MEKKIAKEVTIVGAGLVGSLWAVYLSKAGYNVTIYEARKDIRKADISAGKSINLALSNRGWKALDTVGVGDEIRKFAIPMPGRIMHDTEGNLTYQAYGKEGEAIYSVSRGHINAKMMDIAEEHGNATIHYNHQCVKVDMDNSTCWFLDKISGETKEVKSDLIFAADGAFSAIRYKGMQKLDRFNFSQQFIADGYREILLPANADGSYKLEKNALHIWPRGKFMLIALPNEDGSFTCTLFMPFEGDENAFDKLVDKVAVDRFFKTVFPDFYALMPEIADAWEDHPLSALAIMRSYPWHYKQTALMGDAAHATVPFYGQGMNAGFEDCTVLHELMLKHDHDWDQVFEEYSRDRKKDGDALQDLSLYNYYVMRDYVADPEFLLRKKIEAKFAQLYPNHWMPLYSKVSFSHIPYSEAYREINYQNDIMRKVMDLPEITTKWDQPEVMDYMLDLVKK